MAEVQNNGVSIATKRLCRAIFYRDVEKVKAALKSGADPNYERLGPQESPALLSIIPSDQEASKIDIEILGILLEAGANPNYRDINGSPILLHASTSKSPEMLKMLLNAGADPNLPHGRFGSVLDTTIYMIDNIRDKKNGPKYKNIKILCEVTNYDEVERLKKKYPDYEDLLNCQMPKASMGAVETALDRAAAKMHPELQDGVELPHVMKNVKEYVGYKNVGPGGRRRTKNRKSSKKKTKKRK